MKHLQHLHKKLQEIAQLRFSWNWIQNICLEVVNYLEDIHKYFSFVCKLIKYIYRSFLYMKNIFVSSFFCIC